MTWYDERLEARARAYEWSQSALFILRFGLLYALAALFWTSGLARLLADGLRSYFSASWLWPMTHICFVAFSVLAYEIILFPLSVLAGFSLEQAYGRQPIEFNRWFMGYTGTLLLETLLWTAGFTALYSLMWLFPMWWWLVAGGAYAFFVIGLSVWGPSLLLPRVRAPVEVDDPSLLKRLRVVAGEAGLELTGLAYWEVDEGNTAAPVILAGTGRKRNVIFSTRAWRVYDPSQKLFVAARQMAGHKSGADLKLIALQIALALAVLYGADRIVERFVHGRGLASAFLPELMPFWVVSLFGLTALMGMGMHALIRREELRCDRFALRHAGGKNVLLACLRRDFEYEPFAFHASWWQLLFVRDAPSPEQRLTQAEQNPE
ncbi:MAG: hypothetical protein LBN38_02670 [Verrucomicrobiota bacterium]|jgi:Zn-dependent protease with chaperone function|nr:hypothetical protein [Verrucomicrobiota bacterium]